MFKSVFGNGSEKKNGNEEYNYEYGKLKINYFQIDTNVQTCHEGYARVAACVKV